MLITLLQFHSLEEVNEPIRCPAEGDHLTMLGTRSGLRNASNDSSDGSWVAKGIVKTWVDKLLALKEISRCVHSAMRIGSGRPANANKGSRLSIGGLNCMKMRPNQGVKPPQLESEICSLSPETNWKHIC